MAVEEKRPAKKHANYFVVFIALAILTAIEVGVTQIPLTIPKGVILIPLALIKASLVALFYMHLRSDRKLFSAMFAMGIAVGVALLVSFIVLLNTNFGQAGHLH